MENGLCSELFLRRDRTWKEAVTMLARTHVCAGIRTPSEVVGTMLQRAALLLLPLLVALSIPVTVNGSFDENGINITEVTERVLVFDTGKSAVHSNVIVVDTEGGLVVVDTISMLYRLEMGKNNDVYDINRELGRQISYLSEISRKKDIPVLITNQVYADFNRQDNSVNLDGGDIIKYGSKCLIELRKARASNRVAILRKHRSIREEKEVGFEIVEKGIK